MHSHILPGTTDPGRPWSPRLTAVSSVTTATYPPLPCCPQAPHRPLPCCPQVRGSVSLPTLSSTRFPSWEPRLSLVTATSHACSQDAFPWVFSLHSPVLEEGCRPQPGELFVGGARSPILTQVRNKLPPLFLSALPILPRAPQLAHRACQPVLPSKLRALARASKWDANRKVREKGVQYRDGG